MEPKVPTASSELKETAQLLGAAIFGALYLVITILFWVVMIVYGVRLYHWLAGIL